jgi:hypothetical protein
MQTGCSVLVVGSAITAPALLVAASIVYGNLVGEVNADKPFEDRIKAGDRTKILNVLGQHANAFPTSRKRVLLVWLGLWGIICFLTFVIAAVMCFGSFK